MKTSIKSLILSTSYFNRKSLTKSILCTLALSSGLLISGQAFAVPLTSAGSYADFTGLTHWSTGLCGTSVVNPSLITPNVDTFTICNGHTLTLGVPTSNIAGIIVNGTLTLGTIPLTMSAGSTLTNNGGTISTGGAAHVLPNIVHTAGSTTLTAANITNISGAVTYTTGTFVLPTSLTTVNGLFSGLFGSGAAFTMPATLTSLAGGVTVHGGALTLSAANIVKGTVTIGTGGSIAGMLKLKDAAHTVSGATGSIAKLDLSTSAPATTAATAIAFIPAAGAAIAVNGFIVPPSVSIPLTCTGTAGGTAVSPITSATSPAATYSCTN